MPALIQASLAIFRPRWSLHGKNGVWKHPRQIAPKRQLPAANANGLKAKATLQRRSYGEVEGPRHIIAIKRGARWWNAGTQGAQIGASLLVCQAKIAGIVEIKGLRRGLLILRFGILLYSYHRRSRLRRRVMCRKGRHRGKNEPFIRVQLARAEYLFASNHGDCRQHRRGNG